MRKYLLSYKNYKTDFLIFTQTDYFSNKLTYRMIENLNDLSSALELKKNIDRFIQGKLVELSEDDQKFISKIEILHQKFKNMFYINNRSVPLTFYEIIDSITVEIKEDDIDKRVEEQNQTADVHKTEEFSLSDILVLIVLVVLLCFLIYLIITERIKFN